MSEKIEEEKDVFTLPCRSTGRGAYTTMGGFRYNESRSGNHWMEEIPVQVGDKIHITDITNSGRHQCRTLEVVSVKPLKTKTLYEANTSRDIDCRVCSELRW